MIPRKLPKRKKRLALPGETPIVECRPHLNWVRKHGCCVPGCDRTNIETAHVRKGTDGGMGKKPSDKWAISLCFKHHRKQHAIGEPEFERRHGIDMKQLAMEFARKSPHRNKLGSLEVAPNLVSGAPSVALVPDDYQLTRSEEARGARLEPITPPLRCTDIFRNPIEAVDDAA
jgi:hypothetical protein